MARGASHRPAVRIVRGGVRLAATGPVSVSSDDQQPIPKSVQDAHKEDVGSGSETAVFD